MLGIGLDEAQRLAEAASEAGVCEVANDNAPGQVVLSGTKGGVDRAVELAKSYGAKRAIPLNVSAPFHCQLMGPAADVMRVMLAETVINPPAVPVVANVVAEPLTEPDSIRAKLVEQVTGTVRWRECVSYMAGHGVSQLYEVGSGKVLCGLARQIHREIQAVPVGTIVEIEALAKELS